MVFDRIMKEGSNDNSTWTPLGLAAARVLETCKNQKEQRERDAQRTGDDEKKNEEQRAYIEQRLKEIAAFEDRLRPGYRSRRKRN